MQPWTANCKAEQLGRRGGFFVGSAGSLSVKDIADGTANTAAFSERMLGGFKTRTFDTLGNSRRLSPVGGPCRSPTLTTDILVNACEVTPLAPNQVNLLDHGIGFGSTIYGHLHHTIYNHLFTPNSRVMDCNSCQSFIDSPNESMIATARSYHPGGVNVLMGDGAVRSVGNNVDLPVWRAIGTRAGDEQLSNTAF